MLTQRIGWDPKDQEDEMEEEEPEEDQDGYDGAEGDDFDYDHQGDDEHPPRRNSEESDN